MYRTALIPSLAFSQVPGRPLTPRQQIDSVAYALLSQEIAGATSCSSGQVPRWSGSGWMCGDDANSGGSVTSVSGTAPISVTPGATPTVSIGQAGASASGYLSSTDWSAFNNKQARVTGSCAVGSYVRAVAANGTVTCGTDANSGGTVTAVNVTAPLTSSGGTAPTIALPTNCTGGQVLQWNGTAWACADNGVASGLVAYFNAAACPAGWTELTAARGRYIVGLPAGGTLDATVGTALSDEENRPTGDHGHTIVDPGHRHTPAGGGSWISSQAGNGVALGQGPNNWPQVSFTSTNTTGITIPAGHVIGGPSPAPTHRTFN